VDRTFGWFERHGRSAVFFGRMVPIVRSFVSVPAGVVKMPFGQFLLYTAGGSLIWNGVLIGLGVALGDVINDYLHVIDYLIYAAIVLAVGWFVWRKASGKLRRPPDAGRQLAADERDAS
jgi:membrane protein DedA with SNARE-associated domain